MPFINIRNIYKKFGQDENERVVLDQLSLTINQGDFITVVGGNGAGKSTLLNAIAGTLMIDDGQIIMHGKNIATLKEHERAIYMSRVFQNAMQGTAPRMTIAENMALALRRLKKRGLKLGLTQNNRQFFKEQLQQLDLNLEDRLDVEMGILSGGQRQAIALLMATMLPTELLLLDEHTSALDPKMQKKVMALTKQIVEQKNITTLMITHNVQDALTYGNRLIVLQQGKVIKDFSKEEKRQLKTDDIYRLYD